MEIPSVSSFLDYYRRIRGRTMHIAGCIPPEHIEWTYQPAKFTLGDLLRHIAALERYMFCENFCGRPSSYPGHGKSLADGYDNILGYMRQTHNESLGLIASLGDDDLRRKCRTPAGIEISTWKWMRAMVEHEIHHRGQIFIYLGMLGVANPPLYGLTEEEVLERSRPARGQAST